MKLIIMSFLFSCSLLAMEPANGNKRKINERNEFDEKYKVFCAARFIADFSLNWIKNYPKKMMLTNKKEMIAIQFLELKSKKGLFVKYGLPLRGFLLEERCCQVPIPLSLITPWGELELSTFLADAETHKCYGEDFSNYVIKEEEIIKNNNPFYIIYPIRKVGNQELMVEKVLRERTVLECSRQACMSLENELNALNVRYLAEHDNKRAKL